MYFISLVSFSFRIPFVYSPFPDKEEKDSFQTSLYHLLFLDHTQCPLWEITVSGNERCGMLINSQHLQWDVRGSKVVFTKKLMMGSAQQSLCQPLGKIRSWRCLSVRLGTQLDLCSPRVSWSLSDVERMWLRGSHWGPGRSWQVKGFCCTNSLPWSSLSLRVDWMMLLS